MGFKPKPFPKELTVYPTRLLGLIEPVRNTSGFIKQTEPPNWAMAAQLFYYESNGKIHPEEALFRESTTKVAVAVTDVYVSLYAASMTRFKEVELRVVTSICLAGVSPLNEPRALDIYRQSITETGKILFPKVIVASGRGANLASAANAIVESRRTRVEFEMLLDGRTAGFLAATFYAETPPLIEPQP